MNAAKAAIDGRCIVPASVTISSPTISPKEGDTLQLTAVARDATGQILAGLPVTWSSLGPGIATVSPTGLLQVLADGHRHRDGDRSTACRARRR